MILGTDLTIKSPLAGENLSRANLREVKTDGNETFRAPHLTGLFHHQSESQGDLEVCGFLGVFCLVWVHFFWKAF